MDRDHVEPARTQTFLVERYWPGVDEAIARGVVASLEQAARAMTAEGTPVAHIGSILMPADQVVFSLIEAADERAARQVNERADVPIDRIAAAVTFHLRVAEGDPDDFDPPRYRDPEPRPPRQRLQRDECRCVELGAAVRADRCPAAAGQHPRRAPDCSAVGGPIRQPRRK